MLGERQQQQQQQQQGTLFFISFSNPIQKSPALPYMANKAIPQQQNGTVKANSEQLHMWVTKFKDSFKLNTQLSEKYQQLVCKRTGIM